jgi:hypothetical protein
MTEHHDPAPIGPVFPATGWSARQLVELACRMAEQDLAKLSDS